MDGADKDDDTLLQPLVFFSFCDQIKIHHAVIISTSSAYIILFTFLYLNIIETAVLVVRHDIQTDSFRVRFNIDHLLRLNDFHLFDMDTEDFLHQRAKYSFVLHDFCEEKIVGEIQILKCFLIHVCYLPF